MLVSRGGLPPRRDPGPIYPRLVDSGGYTGAPHDRHRLRTASAIGPFHGLPGQPPAPLRGDARRWLAPRRMEGMIRTSAGFGSRTFRSRWFGGSESVLC